MNVERLLSLFHQSIRVINVGVPTFADDLRKQGVPVQSVDWRPAAGGNEKIAGLLKRIREKTQKES